MSDEVTEEEIVLRWQKFASYQSVSQRLLESAEFSTYSDHVFGTLAFRLTTYVLEHKLDSATKNYTVPASWWQHFKRDVLDRRFVPRRFKRVRYVTKQVTWENGLLFPDAKYPKELGEPVRFVRRTD